MTGRSVIPPTTLASAPSMPATTTTADAFRSARTWASSRWIPATPASYTRATGTPMNSRVTTASSATGRSEVPALTTRTDLPAPGFRRRPPFPRALRWMTTARARDRDALGHGFPFAEDDFGKVLAEASVMVDQGGADRFEGEAGERLQGLARAHTPAPDVLENLTETRRIHSTRSRHRRHRALPLLP